MPGRQVPRETQDDWRQLASIFDELLGGSIVSQQAARYLRNLANNTLPQNEFIPLPWHESGDVDVLPRAREEPHPCVLAVLCPSAPLRAVWRRGR